MFRMSTWESDRHSLLCSLFTFDRNFSAHSEAIDESTMFTAIQGAGSITLSILTGLHMIL